MKKLVLAGAALAAFALGGPALAADLPVKAPILPPVYDWTGFYIGANAGYSFGRSETDLSFPGLPLISGKFNMNGGLAGGQAGYNWQVNPKWVVGFEADIQWARQTGDFALADGPFCVTSLNPNLFPTQTCNTTTAALEQRLAWFGTGRLRLGVLPAPEWLFYATGGVAFGEIQNSVSIVNTTTVTSFGTVAPPTVVTSLATAAGSTNNTRVGWTVGAGTEVVLRGPWTMKFEYLYADYGTFSNTYTLAGVPVLTTSSHVKDNVLRIGVNYRFGGPVVANY